MRSSKFYPTRAVSCVVLLLLLMNAFSAWAQKISPVNGTCMALTGNYNFQFTGTETNATWSTRGDIEIVLVSADRNTVTIKSKAGGYGKGRLYVTYGGGTCGPQRDYVDVFKVFSNIPAPNFVVGPKCVRPGDTVTYSINSVLTKNLRDEIGIDTYTWVYPSTWDTLYFSSDRSSITLKAPPIETFTGSYTLQVYVGKCNTPNTPTHWGGTATGTVTAYKIEVNKKPEAPMLTADAKCVAPSATGKQVKRFTIANYESGLEYTWEIPSNWTFVNGTFDKTAAWADIEIDNLTGTIKLSATRAGCDAVPSEHKVTRALTTARNTIEGQICVGGDSIKTYTLLNAPNDSKFKWTFQANGADQNTGWMFDGDVDKQTVRIKVGATGGTLSVNSVDCPAVTISLPIKVVPKAPTLKNGQPCLAAGTSGNLYEINPVAGAVEYKWVISGNMLFANGLSTFTGPATQVSVTVPSTATTGTLSVTPTNGTCFDSKNKLDYIIGISPATPIFAATATVGGVIYNPTCYNANVTQEVTFRTSTTVSGGVYEWQVIDQATSLPTNKWTIKTGTPTASSTATFVTTGTSGTTGSYRVQARVKSGTCPVSAWGNSAIFAPLLGAMITAEPIEDAGGQYGEELRAVQTNGVRFQTGTTYQWFKNGTAVAGPTTSNFLRLESQDITLGQVYRVVVTRGTCTTNSPEYTSDYDLVANDPTAARVASPEGTQADGVSVHPNPSNGEFTLTLPAFKGQAQVALKTLQGRTVFRKEVGQQQSKLAPGKLTTGVYLLQVTLDGKTVTKKVQIQK